MTRDGTARLLTGVSAAAFLLSAALLGSSYGSVVTSAKNAPADIATLVPALWLSLASAMLVFGVLVGSTTRRADAGARLTLLLAALFPAASGICFAAFLGFGSATTILILVAVLTFAAAAVRPSRGMASSVAEQPG
jgi:hypothetical protein